MRLQPGEIACPHCFRIFQHSEAHFRASHAAHWENSATGRRKVESAVADARLGAFLESFSSPPPQEGALRNPVIVSEAMGERLEGDEYILGRYYAVNRDEGAVVSFAIDEFGERSSERLCPHCHGPLLEKSGFLEFYTVALIGEGGSGKTSYLDSLSCALMEDLPNMGLGLLAVSDEGAGFERGAEGGPPQPVAFRVMSISEHRDLAYIAFYDTPGALVDSAGGKQALPAPLAHADAVILLIDPVRTGLRDAILQNDPSLGGAQGRSSGAVPLFRIVRKLLDHGSCQCFALALSKTDLLDFPEGAPLGPNSRFFRKCAHSGGFDAQEAREVAGEAENALQAIAPQLLSYLSFIEPSKRSFFAVSSLGHRPQEGREPNPLRVEEPFLWILTRFGILREKEEDVMDDSLYRASPRKKKAAAPLWMRDWKA
jgi:hypothetical protein